MAATAVRTYWRRSDDQWAPSNDPTPPLLLEGAPVITDEGPHYLDVPSGGGASTPDQPRLLPGGKVIDVRMKVAPDVWDTGTSWVLIDSSDWGNTNGRWMIYIYNDTSFHNRLTAVWHNAANVNQVADIGDLSTLIGVTNGVAVWLRVVMDPTAGTFDFYSSPDGAQWLQMASQQTGFTTTGVNATGTPPGVMLGQTSAFGGLPMVGKFYAAQVVIGTDRVLDVDWQKEPIGTGPWQGYTGETWTRAGTSTVIELADQRRVTIGLSFTETDSVTSGSVSDSGTVTFVIAQTAGETVVGSPTAATNTHVIVQTASETISDSGTCVIGISQTASETSSDAALCTLVISETASESLVQAATNTLGVVQTAAEQVQEPAGTCVLLVTETSSASTVEAATCVVVISQTASERSSDGGAVTFIISVLSGTTYYVDPAGSDAADGLTTGTAWQTLSKVNGFSFSAGDRVLFKRGSTYRGATSPMIQVSSSNVTFGDYGTGAKPIISGGDLVTGWSLASGSTYQATRASMPSSLPVVITFTVGGVTTRLELGTGSGSLTANQWFWASGVLYINLAGTNPTTGDVELAARIAMDSFHRDSITVQNIKFAYNHDGCLALSDSFASGHQVLDCDFQWQTMDVHAGCIYFRHNPGTAGCKVLRCTFDQMANEAAYVQATKNVEFAFNTITNSGAMVGDQQTDGVQFENTNSGDNSDGLWVHDNQITMGATTVKGCVIVNADNSVGASASGIIENNVLIGGHFGVAHGASNLIVRQNDISGQTAANACGIYTQPGLDFVGMTITYNRIHGVDCGIFMDGSSNNREVTIAHNTVVNAARQALYFNTNLYGLIEDNIYWSTGAHPTVTTLYVLAVSSGHTLVCDYNLFDNAYAHSFIFGVTQYASLAAWSAGTGFDTHSIAGADPLFTNAGTGDYTLRPGSPAINAGTTVAGISEVVYGSAPDLGAFEVLALVDLGTATLVVAQTASEALVDLATLTFVIAQTDVETPLEAALCTFSLVQSATETLRDAGSVTMVFPETEAETAADLSTVTIVLVTTAAAERISDAGTCTFAIAQTAGETVFDAGTTLAVLSFTETDSIGSLSVAFTVAFAVNRGAIGPDDIVYPDEIVYPDDSVFGVGTVMDVGTCTFVISQTAPQALALEAGTCTLVIAETAAETILDSGTNTLVIVPSSTGADGGTVIVGVDGSASETISDAGTCVLVIAPTASEKVTDAATCTLILVPATVVEAIAETGTMTTVISQTAGEQIRDAATVVMVFPEIALERDNDQGTVTLVIVASALETITDAGTCVFVISETETDLVTSADAGTTLVGVDGSASETISDTGTCTLVLAQSATGFVTETATCTLAVAQTAVEQIQDSASETFVISQTGVESTVTAIFDTVTFAVAGTGAETLSDAGTCTLALSQSAAQQAISDGATATAVISQTSSSTGQESGVAVVVLSQSAGETIRELAADSFAISQTAGQAPTDSGAVTFVVSQTYQTGGSGIQFFTISSTGTERILDSGTWIFAISETADWTAGDSSAVGTPLTADAGRRMRARNETARRRARQSENHWRRDRSMR